MIGTKNQPSPIEETKMTTNRFSVVVAVVVIAALALLTVSMIAAPRSSASGNSNAYLAQRQGEWAAGASAQQAYLDQRHEEQTTAHAVNGEQAYQEFRHSEQTTGVNPILAYLDYRRGEWSGK
jgi:hypothetical protein